ncbi:hypothetical protein CEXT_583611 [Caerostris extrusa]|uniref:Uncharacterized protein n=1 Tax=Caerostris extrusa TaxID=172846 RepID=A0AAV4XRS4_CAEEX|nr:hypothetical protein CEXT_583611 [Caerostris extrusa]
MEGVVNKISDKPVPASHNGGAIFILIRCCNGIREVIGSSNRMFWSGSNAGIVFFGYTLRLPLLCPNLEIDWEIGKSTFRNWVQSTKRKSALPGRPGPSLGLPEVDQ